MTVLDVSNHDYPTFQPACFKAAGVERVIIGCWQGDLTADMLTRCRERGIVAEDLYAFLYYGLAWERRELENALIVAANQGGIKRIWLDCEATFTDHTGDLDTEAKGMTPGVRVARTKAAQRTVELAGIEAGIYTSSWWWPEKMSNSEAFSDLKLWHSAYGTNNPQRPIAPVTEVSYGGWTTPAAHQYSSTIVVCGRNRDHNYWFLEEDAVTTQEYETLLLACFSGKEEASLPREQRLTNAIYRATETAEGRRPSIAEMAAAVTEHEHGGVKR